MISHRQFTKADISIWNILAKNDFLEEDFATTEYLEENWDTLLAWILENDKDWIGVIIINRKHHDFNPNGIHFVQIWTSSQYRGKGYAKLLMEIGLRNSLGFTKSVCINPNNVASIKLFEGYGFTKQHPHKTWDVYICEKFI